MEEQLRKELQECNRKLSLTAGDRERSLKENFHNQIETTSQLRTEVIELRNQIKSYGDHIANIGTALQNISQENAQLKLINAELEKTNIELMASLTVLQSGI